ncbi:MAG: hypothetical protein PVF96_06275 [Candidatus Bathyarchaeota archaeon]
MKYSKDIQFWIAVVIILATIILSVATYLRWFNLNFFVGPYRFTHWLSWIGTLFIAVMTPLYYILKRRGFTKLKALLKVHIFGNLISFFLISIHYAQQVGRPPRFYPDLSTGLVLYVVMPLLVASGFLHRFKILKTIKPHLNRFFHVSITFTFYLVILVHILQGVDII